MKKSTLITVVGLILLLGYVYFHSKTLLILPPVWPDEAVYASSAERFLKQGNFGAGVWESFGSFGKQTVYYPPLFFIHLAILFKFISTTIYSQRIVSFVLSLGTLAIFIHLSKIMVQSKIRFPYWLGLMALACDIYFIKSSHISRMEIWVIFLGFVSLFLSYIASKHQTPKKWLNLLWFLSGSFSALAFMTHYVGMMFIVMNIVFLLLQKKHLTNFAFIIYCILGFSLVSAIWVIYVFTERNMFFEQMNNLFMVHRLNRNWMWWVFHWPPLIPKMIFLIQFILSILAIFLSVVKKKLNYLFLASNIVISWGFAIYGGSMWYYVYPLPFIYLFASYVLTSISTRSVLYRFVISLTLLSIALNFIQISQTLAGVQSNAFVTFSQKITDHIPENKTVFLTVIPDVYFELKQKQPNRKIYEFPAVITSKADYLTTLNNSDYVVFNGLYEISVHRDLLIQYLNLNAWEIAEIEEAGYFAKVIKLKENNREVNF